MNYEYYYNFTPEHGKVRNNLIYTSLISQDKKTFVQWYHNDTEYHRGKNQIVDPELMEEKWDREVKFLPYMSALYPYKVPRILDIDYTNKKIFLEIDGVDLWQRSLDNKCSYENIVTNWKEQMLDIVTAHKEIGLYKYSMHPSSYFIVEDRLVTINYFFVYFKNEGPKILKDHQSHISLDRQAQMKTLVESQGIKWDQPESLDVLQRLCFDSFRTNFPQDFIDKAKEIYHD